jgi:A/G-specific adenine glycosylase
MPKPAASARDLSLPVPPAEWARRVADWYVRRRRDLPWRRTRDPYAVWLSEIMLQQTQVKTVIPYFERFLAAYPTIEELAAADPVEVLDLWAGLGYYRRARNLHACARAIKERHGGRFPEDFAGLIALPGIGRYSAGAVLSIAFGKPYPIVDGNIRRVLCRCLGLREPPSEPTLWRLLERVVEHPEVASRVSEFNQGLMELGALVCHPRNPECGACPLGECCTARARGIQNEIPAPGRARRSETHHYTVAVASRGEAFLMSRNSDGPFLKGFWEFPKVAGRLRGKGMIEAFAETHGLRLRLLRRLDVVRHQITFRSLRFHPGTVALENEPDSLAFRWVRFDEPGYPKSAYVRKIADRVSGRAPDASDR